MRYATRSHPLRRATDRHAIAMCGAARSLLLALLVLWVLIIILIALVVGFMPE